MIGLIVGESQYVLEFSPKFGGPYFPKHQIKIKHNKCRDYGEYGISFSKGKSLRTHTIWLHWAESQTPWDLRRLIGKFK